MATIGDFIKDNLKRLKKRYIPFPLLITVCCIRPYLKNHSRITLVQKTGFYSKPKIFQQWWFIIVKAIWSNSIWLTIIAVQIIYYHYFNFSARSNLLNKPDWMSYCILIRNSDSGISFKRSPSETVITSSETVITVNNWFGPRYRLMMNGLFIVF